MACTRHTATRGRRCRTRVVGWVKGVSRGASAPVLIASRRAASRSCRRTRRSRQAAPSRWTARPAAVPRHGAIARPRGAHGWTEFPVRAHRTGRDEVSRGGKARGACTKDSRAAPRDSSPLPLNLRRVCAARRRGGPESRATPRWHRGEHRQVLRASGSDTAYANSPAVATLSSGDAGRQVRAR